MTPEQINMAIAESCGWTGVKYSDAYGGWQGYEKKGNWFTTQIPNYYGDLNAMHEAEETLGEMLCDYVRHLAEKTTFEHRFEIANRFALLHATAAQRAEAFLRTLGKWKD